MTIKSLLNAAAIALCLVSILVPAAHAGDKINNGRVIEGGSDSGGG